ncbi:MAG: hypothetical protein ACR2OH_05890 [Microthrixaceae bacterium]
MSDRDDDMNNPRRPSDADNPGPAEVEAAASALLESRLAGVEPPQRQDPRVEELASRMQLVRSVLADTSDAPDEDDLEESLQRAMRPATAPETRDSDGSKSPTAGVDSVPRRSAADGRTGKWLAGVAAAVVLVLAGFVLFDNSAPLSTSSDEAFTASTDGDVQSDTEDAAGRPADGAAEIPAAGTESGGAGNASRGEDADADSGARSQGANDPTTTLVEGFEDDTSDPLSAISGLEFTIIVPIQDR